MAYLPTFGCGTILPGYGPFSFTEFNTNFVDMGNGTPPVGGGIRINVPDKGRPGTPGGPGEGGGDDGDGDEGGGSGPSTPGPAGPATPGPSNAGPASPTTPGPSGPSAPGPSGPSAPGPSNAGPASPSTTAYWRCKDGVCQGAGWSDSQIERGLHTAAGFIYTTKAECERFCGPTTPGPATPRDTITGGFNPIPPNTPNTGGGLDPTLFSPTITGGFNPIPPNISNGGNGVNRGDIQNPSDSPIAVVPTTGAAALPPRTGTYNPPGGDSGGVVSQLDRFKIDNYLSKGASLGEIDLSNPEYENAVLRQNKDLLDEDISLDVSYFTTKLVKNTSKYTSYFSDAIDVHINYLLTNIGNETRDWTHVSIFGLTEKALLSSLKPEILDRLRKVKNYNDTYLTDTQIFSIFANRILDNTLDDLSIDDFLSLQNKERNKPLIKKSSNQKVNEMFVLNDLIHSQVSLDSTKHNKELVKLLPNWKVLSTDIDKYIPIKYGDETLKYYVKDDDTFIDRESLSIKDGDYFIVYSEGENTKLYCESEKDHAYLLSEYDKQRYINILGGDGRRTLTVSSLASDDIEFSYPLNSPRQNYYILSCTLSSLETVPSEAESDYLKTTSVEYGLMDTTTELGLAEVDEYIRYKANYRTFILEDDDRIFDYVESTGKIKIKQTDLLLTSPKDAKHLPLLTRQIPWYIILYPTNRPEYSLFGDKSQITKYDPSGVVERTLFCAPSISRKFNIDQKEQFLQYSNAYLNNQTNVFGEVDLQGRITKLTPTSSPYLTGYKEEGVEKPAESFTPNRKKTGFRIIKEVINELDTNYLLGLNGIGKSVTIFDVVSRLSLSQYANFTKKENFSTLFKLIKNGLFNDVKLIAPVKNSNDNLGKYKTQLVRKKAAAAEDTFTPIKLTADQYYITPPTTTEPPSRTR